MSCANKTYASKFVIPAPTDGPQTVLRMIVMLVEAFHEACDMRRDAYRERPMCDE
jgi:hypothetical protein